MKIWVRFAIGLATLATLAAVPHDAFAADAAHPTVVELFQSQGCSDCPPAEANLAAISDRADVLALAFAVDYWDRLGWKDTFSKPEWTQRQYAYARALKRDGVYTPQFVVNGRVEGVGGDAAGLAELVRQGERGDEGPSVRFQGAAVTVGAGKAPPAGAEVLLILYDPRTVEIAVRRGENAGRTLPQRNVVHDVALLGWWRGLAATFQLPEMAESGLAQAAIVQEAGSGPVLAAGKR